jgi:hypothetical protein
MITALVALNVRPRHLALIYCHLLPFRDQPIVGKLKPFKYMPYPS